MTTVHHYSPPPGAAPFAIYEDPEDQEPPSPSDVYEAETSFTEITPDDPITSIELDHEDDIEDELEPYRTSFTSRPSNVSNARSRHVSGVTTTSFVSSLPSEISISSNPVSTKHAPETRCAPRKERPPFRNPASVRAMQMASPPPFATFEPRERVKGTYKMTTPSRSGRSETPASNSRRSMSHRGHIEAHAHTHSPRPTPTPQQHLPLVLLHVTILPMQPPYTHDFMAKAMPTWLVENYKLLEEKLRDIVLMRRGLLIQHPRDEYDVLEERILESLELKTPRLLKCGHFVGSERDAEEHTGDGGGSVTDGSTGRRSRMSGGTITVEEEDKWNSNSEADDASVCDDCHRQVLKPGMGVGAGKKRWDIKIYAANGLMRAGAWSAAWSEMERCDVEITPWIPDEVRKSLDKQLEEQQEAARVKELYEAEVQRRVEEEAARLKRLEIEAEETLKAEEAECRKQIEEEAARQTKIDEAEKEKRRLEDALNDKLEEAKEAFRLEFEAQSLAEAAAVAERFRLFEEELKRSSSTLQPPSMPEPASYEYQHHGSQSRGRPRSLSRRPSIEEIPLGTLLKNYLLLLARDQRNIAIVLLSVFVVFLSTQLTPKPVVHTRSVAWPDEQTISTTVSSVVVTTTATMTATAVSTTTVTQIAAPEDTVRHTSLVTSSSISAVEPEATIPNAVEDQVPASVASAAPIESSSTSTSPASFGSSTDRDDVSRSPATQESFPMWESVSSTSSASTYSEPPTSNAQDSEEETNSIPEHDPST